MVVIKRDGRVVPFQRQKIINAISKAGNVRESTKQKIAIYIEDMDRDEISVEEIQDIVETKLMESSYKDVAKSYIIYRSERNKEREKKSALVKKVMGRVNSTTIENSNANVDERSFSGREKEASSDIGKTIALDYGGLSKEIAEAHKEMLVYQHDLEKAIYGIHNCLIIDFKELFTHGFKTRNGDVRSPKSFSTACQLVAVSFQCQSQVQFGGVGSMHIDYDLAPFVKMSFVKHFRDGMKYVERCSDDEISEFKSWFESNDLHIDNEEMKKNHPEAYFYAMDMLDSEGRQAAQGLYHNLNTLESRQGSQVPFTSINLGRDTSVEGRMVTKWMMQASLDGIGEYHRTSIFPISIFQYKPGVNADEGDPNYDLKKLAIQSMSKRIYPNWANGNWSQAHEDPDNIDTFFSTMGCRTLTGYDRHGLGYTRCGRGNNVPNTIILPKLGIEYGICLGKRDKPDLEGFWNALEDTLKLTERGLLERYSIMIKQSPKSAPFMYQNHTIKGSMECKDTVENALKHGTLAIGYIGIAEMCQALFGKNHVKDKEVRDFALSVVARIRSFADEASERNDLNFSCYATPAEGLCRTALKALREQYGVIENVTSRDYLTNSHHVPVWENVSIHEKLQVESPFCKYPTGGCITYIELPSSFMKNPKAVEDIIDYAFKECDIPYLAFNFPIDSCLDCGHQGEFDDHCTECGSMNIQKLRRVTGYLSTDYRNFNEGKMSETEDRVKHTKETIITGDEV